LARGKRYSAGAEAIDQDRQYPSNEAVELVKGAATAKFDETIEVHIRLGVDPRQADQQIRGTIQLPHGTGKAVRVAVFAQGEKVKEAEEAGADIVGLEDLAAKVEKGEIDFEAAIATPDVMSTVGKIGKILGPRGLMPNPKVGTVTFDVAKAVSAIKSGKVEYKVDKFGISHVSVGKASFTAEQLDENYTMLIDEIMRVKPASSKGRYIKSIAMTSTMGPSVRIAAAKPKDDSDH